MAARKQHGGASLGHGTQHNQSKTPAEIPYFPPDGPRVRGWGIAPLRLGAFLQYDDGDLEP